MTAELWNRRSVLKSSGDFLYQYLERRFTDQQLGGFLVTTDFSQSATVRAWLIRLLNSTGSRALLRAALVVTLLPWGFTPVAPPAWFGGYVP
ncbi:hypothetical protein TNIN_6281 [Trichonephila inaurata madagascariensis]|uniref:Uncharacterized protein n=1 Tax=Trichonephila inaurata madagascariensis TaxID=2747483 RepID=A0A8X7BRH7_9ARAC|nr:hypothetical protein TNIN_6281 [Trichonephila inaurata madagascariensis]